MYYLSNMINENNKTMKAITNFLTGTPVLVEGIIENGRFCVSGVAEEKTPDVNTDNLNTVYGSNNFDGCVFRSNEIGGEYLSTFYLVEGEVKMNDKKVYSDVIVGSAGYESSSNNMPADKSDEMNDLIFGENNW